MVAISRFCNVAGPCRPDKHYLPPAQARLIEARSLIDAEPFCCIQAA
jgi:hypothetical protein